MAARSRSRSRSRAQSRSRSRRRSVSRRRGPRRNRSDRNVCKLISSSSQIPGHHPALQAIRTLAPRKPRSLVDSVFKLFKAFGTRYSFTSKAVYEILRDLQIGGPGLTHMKIGSRLSSLYNKGYGLIYKTGMYYTYRKCLKHERTVCAANSKALSGSRSRSRSRSNSQ